MANAVKHGNAFNLAKRVSFDAAVDEAAFEVTVTDQGAGFELEDVADPCEGDNLLRASGRGLLMMKAFFDEVEVGRCAGTGTRVRLVKYCAKGAS